MGRVDRVSRESFKHDDAGIARTDNSRKTRGVCADLILLIFIFIIIPSLPLSFLLPVH
jgi:hypothetical protein